MGLTTLLFLFCRRYQSVTNWFQNQRSTAKKRAIAPRSRLNSPSTSVMRDADTSDDDDILIRKHHLEDHYQASGPTTLRRPRIDPVRDIIVAQAEARQQRIELALPLSGAAIVPSDNPTHKPTSAPASRAPRAPRGRFSASHRIMGTTGLITRFPRSNTPPILSAFQVSRAPSPGAASNNHSTQPVTNAPDLAPDYSTVPDSPLTDYVYPEDTSSASSDVRSADKGRVNNNPVKGGPNPDKSRVDISEDDPIANPQRTASDAGYAMDQSLSAQRGGSGNGVIVDMEVTEQRDIMSVADLVPRGKRSRPTPHQLAVLRALHAVTSSPSIEERVRVGREIGM